MEVIVRYGMAVVFLEWRFRVSGFSDANAARADIRNIILLNVKAFAAGAELDCIVRQARERALFNPNTFGDRSPEIAMHRHRGLRICITVVRKSPVCM